MENFSLKPEHQMCASQKHNWSTGSWWEAVGSLRQGQHSHTGVQQDLAPELSRCQGWPLPSSGLVQDANLIYKVLMEELDFHVDFLKTENYFYKVFFFIRKCFKNSLLKFLSRQSLTFWNLSAREPQISLSLFLSLPLKFFLS